MTIHAGVELKDCYKITLDTDCKYRGNHRRLSAGTEGPRVNVFRTARHLLRWRSTFVSSIVGYVKPGTLLIYHEIESIYSVRDHTH